ncbi:hypothetical protein K9N68_00660 [Kovacikia minuta CCNUW1]|uniref:LIC_10190 family membrane protein n=1 Tax=Kovacikia minuta TaxID=2931930 RepID=UPI001CCF88DD|nr:hypothetical protein [Kovacikia minuta]UBF26560.1 hypothetical protein K9N68_00660 [Kovacikia minuta CCNUW1]
MAKFGTVPGLALLFPNLGFTSSWLALAAPLNSPMLEARVSAVTNGFIFFITLLHLLICLRYAFSKAAQVTDWFIVCAFLILIPLAATNNLISLILVSPSPDLPIIFLPPVATWIMILILQAETRATSQGLPKQAHHQAKLLPLTLAIGAVAIKLTALPLLLVTFIFSISGKNVIRQFAVTAGLTSLLLLPFLAASLLTSGCPLYPSSALCLDLPWSLPKQHATAIAQGTHRWTTWYHASSKNPSWLSLLLQWVSSSKLNFVMAVLIILTIAFVIYGLATPKVKCTPGYLWTLVLSASGIAFLMMTAPFFRFAIGYLVLIPTLSAAVLLHKWFLQDKNHLALAITRLFEWLQTRQTAQLSSCLSGFVIVLSLTYGAQHAQLLLPPPLKTAQLLQKEFNNITYVSPVNDLCWSAPIPCAFRIENVKLRDPDRGLVAGFVRAD